MFGYPRMLFGHRLPTEILVVPSYRRGLIMVAAIQQGCKAQAGLHAGEEMVAQQAFFVASPSLSPIRTAETSMHMPQDSTAPKPSDYARAAGTSRLASSGALSGQSSSPRTRHSSPAPAQAQQSTPHAAGSAQNLRDLLRPASARSFTPGDSPDRMQPPSSPSRLTPGAALFSA